MPVNCDDPTEVENAAQAALIRKLAHALLVVKGALTAAREAGMVSQNEGDRVNWDALSCIHGCDPSRHPVVGIYALDEGCVVYRTDRLQALCLQHFVSAKDGAIGGLVTVVDRLEEQRDDT
jgi:hypothetical protein